MRIVTTAACILLAASSALATEVLVFRKDSIYKGAAMKVASYTTKGDKLVIKTPNGDVLSAPASSVDWELSRLATEQAAAQEQTALAQAEADRAQRERAAREPSRHLTLVEASRRYGTDKAAVSVASGSAVHEIAIPKEGEGQSQGEGGAGAAEGEGGASGADVAAAEQRLQQAKAERDKVTKELDTLGKDTNPDPIWARNRAVQIEQKRTELASLESRVSSAQTEVDRVKRAQADAARRAKAAAEKEAAVPAEPEPAPQTQPQSPPIP